MNKTPDISAFCQIYKVETFTKENHACTGAFKTNLSKFGRGIYPCTYGTWYALDVILISSGQYYSFYASTCFFSFILLRDDTHLLWFYFFYVFLYDK